MLTHVNEARYAYLDAQLSTLRGVNDQDLTYTVFVLGLFIIIIFTFYP